VSDPETGSLARPGNPPRSGPWRVRALIQENEQLHYDHCRLLLKAPEIAAAAAPGQFIHIWPHPPEEIERPPCAAILRRPYSISRVPSPDAVEVLLRVRGTGGRILASRRPGEALDIIGPLGRGFSFADAMRLAVIVAGGVGIAPVPFLIERLAAQGVQVIVLAGAEHDGKIPFVVQRPRAGRATIPELSALGAEVSLISEEVEGILITEVFEARLDEFPLDTAGVFGIGPRAMLKRLFEVTGAHFALQVSLEERMACGLGACRSCVVPALTDTGTAYRTVCRDGPVFLASEIDWRRLEP